jgi:hypothetical protein
MAKEELSAFDGVEFRSRWQVTERPGRFARANEPVSKSPLIPADAGNLALAKSTDLD